MKLELSVRACQAHTPVHMFQESQIQMTTPDAIQGGGGDGTSVTGWDWSATEGVHHVFFLFVFLQVPLLVRFGEIKKEKLLYIDIPKTNTMAVGIHSKYIARKKRRKFPTILG